jgi:hypothetical protein
MKPLLFRALALACACLGTGVSAHAQEVEDPFETARFRLGPVRFTPVFEITSVGHDSNVFNESQDPKSDTTAAFGPTVQLWMRPAGTRLSAKLGGQYLYFKEFANERAWNTRNEVRWEVPLSRITPFVEGNFVDTQERQGYEIDARARRRDDGFTVGTALRVSGKTSFVLSHRRSNVEYDEDAEYLGAPLGEALNRQEDLTRLQFRYALTPLTTLVVDTDVARDRFDLNNVRDADNISVLPGFELNPLALISGRVFVGFRQFDPVSSDLPDYRGVVASVDASYILLGATRFQFKVDRDVVYSYEALRPYYALLDTGVTVTQRVTHAWELVGRASRQTLDYRHLQGTTDSDAGSDRGHVLGGGIGYRIGETLRLGVDANHYTRRSEFDSLRNYDGVRVFGSISYGIRQ